MLTRLVIGLALVAFASQSYALEIGDDASSPPSDPRFLTTDLGMHVHWEGTGTRFLLDARGASTLERDAVEAAIVSAIEAWDSALGAGFSVTYGGLIEDAPIGYRSDGPNTNVIAFQTEDWNPANESLALTLSTFVQETGELLDADIVFNEATTTWSTEGGESAYDLQSVLLHEIGHALGLAHQEAEEPLVMHPTLDPGTIDRRELSAEDKAAVRALYGSESTPSASDVEAEADEDALAALAEDPWQSSVDMDYPAERDIAFSCSGAPESARARVLSAFALLGLWLVAWARRRTWVAASVLLLAPLSASAATVEALSMDERIAASELIVRGVVIESESVWRGGVIVTRSQVDVETCLLGACPESVWVETLGGSINGVTQSVAGAPEMRVGVEVVTFLRRAELTSPDAWQPVAMGLGVYYVVNDGVHARPATAGLRTIEHALGDTHVLPTEAIELAPIFERIRSAAGRP